DDSWLWHRKLGHLNMEKISHITKNDRVIGVPKIKYEKDKTCHACQIGKQIKSSFKNKKHISTSRPLELLHIDLFGPSRVTSIGGKSYVFVIIDDYSRFTWTIFLAKKNKACVEFSKLCKNIQNSKGYLITSIRSDHGREFENQMRICVMSME
ncbi:DDE-type integrase/transposase/recombinase, partial [Weizmannia coagulans]|nr:DDE-type integrase/transposase/recombinase [Heyndrickxia coagulans]